MCSRWEIIRITQNYSFACPPLGRRDINEKTHQLGNIFLENFASDVRSLSIEQVKLLHVSLHWEIIVFQCFSLIAALIHTFVITWTTFSIVWSSYRKCCGCTFKKLLGYTAHINKAHASDLRFPHCPICQGLCSEQKSIDHHVSEKHIGLVIFSSLNCSYQFQSIL